MELVLHSTEYDRSGLKRKTPLAIPAPGKHSGVQKTIFGVTNICLTNMRTLKIKNFFRPSEYQISAE